MAKLLIVSVGVAGQLHPAIELARRARQLGHRVTFLSRDPSVGDRVEPYGFGFRRIQSARDEEIRQREKQFRKAGRLRRLMRRREYIALAGLRAQNWCDGAGLGALLDELDPDLLLIDSELHELIVLASVGRVPVVVLEYHVADAPAGNVPPMGSRQVPAETMWSRWRCAVEWRLLRWQRAVKRAFMRRYLKGRDKHSTMLELCWQAGLRFGQGVRTDCWHYYHFPRLPHWLLIPSELDFPGALLRRTHTYLGPMILTDRGDALAASECGRLTAFLQQDDARPLILLTVGSILTELSLCRRVIAAVTGQPLRLIVTTGRGTPQDALGELPPNVATFAWLPLPEVIEHAAVVICHGGIGTLLESLSAGVPLLVYSNGGMDRDGNAARVVFHGVGLRGSLRRDRPQHIRAKIECLLRNPGFRTQAQAMQRALEAYAGCTRLDDALHRVFASASERSAPATD